MKKQKRILAITVKRAGKDLSPVHWDKVIGLRAKKNFRADQKISIN
jgi:sialic acid synthase SpsE|tara:strand:- start:59 stop:196 length:138 start_codon:yes stop_codon:yes gene_type:complete